MKHWISAARLRTLPLALSSIFMGSVLAVSEGSFQWSIFILAVSTTILLQVLSNFANDYGDTKNGADSTDRIGPQRAVQAGLISSKQMLNAIYFTGAASFFSGVLLLNISFGGFSSNLFWIFIGLGILAITAAYTYTAGNRPYGYAGLGDVSVFLFFGLLGVMGSYFLYSKTLEFEILLPAIACGSLATGVLNINNIRDMASDKSTGKITIPVRLGRKKAVIYHWLILCVAIISITIFIFFKQGRWYYCLSFPLIILNGYQVAKNENPDPFLKTLALTSVIFVILVGLSLIYK